MILNLFLVYDSWSRYPNGILSGKTHQMGVYSECIDVHQPMQGQYCMTTTKLKTVDGANPVDLKRKDEMESYDHAWNEILGVSQKSKYVSYIKDICKYCK